MAIDYSALALPKPEPTKRLKARRKRQAAKVVQSVRAAVVERAHGFCERCGLYVGLDGHAHHRTPRSRGGTWTLDNILLLCPFCHMSAHRTGAL